MIEEEMIEHNTIISTQQLSLCGTLPFEDKFEQKQKQKQKQQQQKEEEDLTLRIFTTSNNDDDRSIMRKELICRQQVHNLIITTVENPRKHQRYWILTTTSIVCVITI
mmetsp:Transcript_49629/g.55415  ORF Transcript_49629/g.55415 Transcript_49629/m.55415 type:complete len:108 (-) Transcript_49629:51-374(-)